MSARLKALLTKGKKHTHQTTSWLRTTTKHPKTLKTSLTTLQARLTKNHLQGSPAVFGLVLTTSALAVIGLSGGNAAPPNNFVNNAIITGLNEPTNMTFTPDGRMLVLGRRGTIWVTQPGATQVDTTPFLQLTTGQVAYDGERGLLGIALDPNFASNGYYYVYYTASSNLKNRISRFTASGNTTSTATETMIWEMPDQSLIYHQGGSMAFGPDNKLYVSVGDHLDSIRSQSLTSDKGKILRMNSDGTFPTDNPFYDGAGPNRDEIWAYGFRNTFRFSFDSANGRLFAADVGEGSWEEVNVVTKGSNYGWPTCEGTCGTAGMTNPIYVYGHAGGEASITGGFVYRGNQFPSAYQGAYFFGDYSHRWIKYLTLDANGNSTGVQNFDPVAGGDGTQANVGDPVAMAMGPDGSLYYADIGPFQTTNTGKIRKITYTAANQAPTVQSSGVPLSNNTAPLTVNFSSAGTSDPENQTLSYSWNFGDNTTSTSANPSHTYTNRGVYSARLTVSDGTNSVPGDPITITVGRPPVPSIAAPTNGSGFIAGQQINFSGSAADPEDGSVPGSSLEWSIVFHHEDHIHPVLTDHSGSSGTFTVPTSGHDFTGNTSYEITVTATDVDGIAASTSTFINPQKVNLTYNTSPSGGTITIGGIPHITPYTYDTLIGFQYSVSAASPQIIGNGRYAFLSWSNSATQTHNLTVPSSNTSYTATFEQDTSLPAGLKAVYPLEEGSGTTTADLTGNGNLATLISGTTWTTSGRHGKALSFNGSSNYVSAADSVAGNTTVLDLGATGTIEAWVNPLGSGWRSIIAKGDANSTSAHNYAMEITPSNTVECSAGNNAVNSGATTLTNSQWVHLACTWDGSNVRLYRNGTQINSVTQTSTPVGNSAPLYIGQYGGNEDRFNGIIDEVYVYNRALSQAEIQADSNSPVGAPPADTLPPDTSITSTTTDGTTTLPSLTNVTTAVFNFSATESGSFECSIDGGAFAACASPKSHSGLGGGSHTFRVRALDSATPTPNIDPTPASFAWTIDLTAPETTITGGQPSNPSVSANASISFSSSESNSTFLCKIDNNSYVACSSPKAYSALTNGSHTFSVYAVDPAGNLDATPATYTWTVDTTSTCTSVTQYGVSFEFDKEYTCGTFVNGDYWVIPNNGDTAVRVTRITPDFAGGRNGWQVNPSGGSASGFDSRLNYSAGLVPTLPYDASPGKSIIKGVSRTGVCGNDGTGNHYPCLTTAAVLTVLGSIPAANGAQTFRPPYAGTDKTLFTTAQLRTDRLPSLAPVAGAPSLASVERRYQRPQIDLDNSWYGRYMHASENYIWSTGGPVSEYGAEVGSDADDAALRLMLNDSIPSKMPAMVNYVQAGIDMYGMHKSGVTWTPDGGHMFGRKLPAVFAAVLLDDAGMKSEISGATYSTYGDDGHAYYSSAAGRALWGKPCGNGQYEQQQTNDTGPRDCRDPIGMIDGGEAPGTSYQGCCTSGPMKGASLAARLLPEGETVWNYSPLHEYADRWVTFGAWAAPDPWNSQGRTPARNYTNLHGTSKDAGSYESAFVGNMWDAYRSTITSGPPTTDTTPPDTSIASRTPSTTPTNSTTMSFTFTATEAGSFECKHDTPAGPGSYVSCTSPQAYSNLANGSHTFSVRAKDNATPTPNTDASPASYTWLVDAPPTGAPAVSMSAPAPSATVQGNNVTVSASATDNAGGSGISNVQFRLDCPGTSCGNLSSDNTASGTTYSITWSTSTLVNGTHTLSAIATDQAGNQTTSNIISVTVNNPPPPQDNTAPSVPANLRLNTTTTTTTIPLTWNASTDNAGGTGVAGYKLYRSTTANGTYTLIQTIDGLLTYTDGNTTPLTPNTTYYYKVASYDNAPGTNTPPGPNESAQSAAFQVTTASVPAPTVSFSASPASVTTGGASTLSWSTTNATSCSASAAPATTAWNGTKTTGANRTQSLTNLTTTTTYTLTCSNGTSGPTTVRTAVVTVTAATNGNSNTPTKPKKRGDVDNSGRVDILDLGTLLQHYGTVNPTSDVDESGGPVDIYDLGTLLGVYEG